MSNYRRWHVPGGTYFFTVVVERRRPLFAMDATKALLGTAIRTVRKELPFQTVAMVLLPDHLHTIWRLPQDDSDYSSRWQRIKACFTAELRRTGYPMPRVSPARQARGEHGIWQRRFWEHVIEDEAELEAYFDYIHWNPVKHGYVRRPGDWDATTYHRHLRSGHYSEAWGATEPPTIGVVTSDCANRLIEIRPRSWWAGAHPTWLRALESGEARVCRASGGVGIVDVPSPCRIRALSA